MFYTQPSVFVYVIFVNMLPTSHRSGVQFGLKCCQMMQIDFWGKFLHPQFFVKSTQAKL